MLYSCLWWCPYLKLFMMDGRDRNLGGMYALYKAHSHKHVFLFSHSSGQVLAPDSNMGDFSHRSAQSFTVILLFHTDPSSCSVSHHHRMSRRTRDSPTLGDCRLRQLLLCLHDDRRVCCSDGRGQNNGYTDVVHLSKPLQCITLWPQGRQLHFHYIIFSL